MERSQNADASKVTFEEALDRTGFGLYSYLVVSLAGMIVIALVCTAFGTNIIVPTSACELGTTTTQRGMLAGAPVIGLILGGPLWGYLADVWGRRYTLIISLLAAAAVNALASLSVNWLMLMILQFFATFLSAGQFPQAMTIVGESVPMAKRNISILLVGSIFLLSQGLMAVLAIPIIPLTFSYYLPSLGIYWNSWRTLMLVYCTPSLVCALWLYFMSESPKFLFAKGREAEAMETLRKIHKLNNLGSNTQLQISGGILLESIERDESKLGKKSKQVAPLFKTPLLKSTIIMAILFLFQQIPAFMIWLPTISSQFVEILETGEGSNLTLCAIIRKSLDSPPDPDDTCALNVTSLLIVLVVGAVLSVANVLISLIVNYTGRRNLAMFMTALCGVCGIVANLIPNAIASGLVFFIFLLGVVNIGLYTAIAVALFPTALRTLAVALILTGHRIGAFASVQIINQLFESNCEAAFYVYASIFALSTVVAAFLVDDRKLQTERDDATKL
ncbi:putative transporter svop-1 [Maniola jurtina]|uniref:putative transporter svop-1 n=1 Tax=Maniola jurtina TaxID=191418 RepID=UPI001E68A339|nr:putative transporter svop-1 [Maniola jurtina]XP_045767302.1 putative transporter svop-1 [Maniola jurtina]XP_045767303.1 putative transporter svop-1 [Maniola jurtina]XP_045767304.1 putative transporter svop-1 [Maniola jurtina]